MSSRRQRAGHEGLDVESRVRKAEKIARIISLERPLAGARILDVGAGAGVIAAKLGELTAPDGEAWSVDVRDSRVTTTGFRFVRVTGTDLPFEDESFDIVVSNHVIEHVGERADQLEHLRQIARVLRPHGVAYLATPNRWTPIEPHFKLPLLSWLPAGLRSSYVRLARRGPEYDCELLTARQLRALFQEAGLAAVERTLEAIRLTGEIDASRLVRTFTNGPAALHRALRFATPTFVFTARKVREDSG